MSETPTLPEVREALHDAEQRIFDVLLRLETEYGLSRVDVEVMRAHTTTGTPIVGVKLSASV